jgi:hypothetical protein
MSDPTAPPAPPPELLGELSCPSGVVLILDPGLRPLWRHDQPLAADEATDFRIDGVDAERAARLFDRQWHPRFLYDVPAEGVDEVRRSFARLTQQHDFDARLTALPERVTHRARLAQALEQGGAGEVLFQGAWGAAVGDAPSGRLPVRGRRMPPGPDAGRWREVLLECRPGVVAHSERVALVRAVCGRLLFADADAFGAWRNNEPPAGPALCAFSTTWADGVLPVWRDRDADGRLLRVRLDLGTEQTIRRQRRLEEMGAVEPGLFALVSARVLSDGRPILWLYREAADGADDSGWRVLAGDEPDGYLDSAAHVRKAPLRDLLRLDDRLEDVLLAPAGSAFERAAPGESFVVVEGFTPPDE